LRIGQCRLNAGANGSGDFFGRERTFERIGGDDDDGSAAGRGRSGHDVVLMMRPGAERGREGLGVSF
jgi:hypothetical protein